MCAQLKTSGSSPKSSGTALTTCRYCGNDLGMPKSEWLMTPRARSGVPRKVQHFRCDNCGKSMRTANPA